MGQSHPRKFDDDSLNEVIDCMLTFCLPIYGGMRGNEY